MNRMREIGGKEEEGGGRGGGGFFATWRWEKGKGVALCLTQLRALQSARQCGAAASCHLEQWAPHTSLCLP